ncbi:MAG TPA: adenylate/guanylate cyclase domain-containing protein [Anaerolineales bacterium]
MICPNCQTANRENARFCMNCGYAFAPAASCPNCGAPVLPGAKYCSNCGYPLANEAPLSLQKDQLHKYIPKELLTKLQAARAGRHMEGERRIVTMLFCDVTGSTAMAERLDPEEWAEVMNAAFEYLIAPVFRYEGTIPRMMGDALLAFFGAPIAHEDDPERAVRAGLEMVAGIRGYREQIRRERGLDFDVRVGINTGLVVVGGMGSDLRLEYTAMGDAINLAARMEQTAQPGTVQITANTYRLVASLVEVEPLGGIQVKGKGEPVEAFRVVGLQVARARPYGIADVETPLVGRKVEMAALRRSVEQLSQGQGGIVCLVGEAGMGKSRLIDELNQEWQHNLPSGSPVAWHVVRSASFAASRPYGQFRQHLLEQMSISETDPPPVVREKIGSTFAHHPPELRRRAMAVYSRLFGVDDPGERRPGGMHSPPLYTPAVEGDAFKRELFDLVLSLERTWTGGGPSVQVFDDLHWVDPASAELLIYLLQLARQKPILFLCAFRPEPGTPAWSLKRAAESEYGDRYTEIFLNPLPPQDARALIGHHLANAGQHPDLLEQILGKAEGNPLFIEEVVYALLDRGDLERTGEGLRWTEKRQPLEVAIPDSLHSLLLARLDRLEEDSRRTLQLASVIGRSFYYNVLKRIIEIPLEIDRELHKLQLIDLIREAARLPELEYEFRHALTQEAAYRSILLRRRREYHRRVADALEVLFSDRLQDHAELLAHHFDVAGDGRARKYYRLAGEKAAKMYARNEALDFYSRALDIPGSPPPEEMISIHEGRAEIHFSLGQFEPALADFEAALALARAAARTGDEVRLLANLAWLRWSSGKGDEALQLAQEAQAKSLAIGDQSQTLYAAVILGTALQNLGDIPGASAQFRQALYASRRQGNYRMTALSLYYLAMLENFAGRFARAAVCARTACEMYLHMGDRLRACGVLFTQSLAEGGHGWYDRALEVLERGRLLARETSSLWLARYPNQRAWLSAELGDWETAYEFDLAGLHPAHDIPGFREIEISTLINLVLDCTALGRWPEAETFLAEAEKDLGRPEFGSHNWRWRIRLADARARLDLARGDLDAAAQSIASLLEQAQKMLARKYTTRGLVLRGRVHLAQGAFSLAEADLQSALELADSLCYLPAQVEARLLLSDVYQQTGPAEVAKGHDAEASQLVAALDAQIQHPELRRSFERGIGTQLKYND